MSVVAAGAFVALVPLGLVAATTLANGNRRETLALALPLAMAVMSVPLGIAAALGHFDPRVNGAGGWLAAFVTAVTLWRSSRESRRTDRRAARRWRVRAPILLVAAGVVYGLAVVETPIGSRDEGIYTLAALALDRAGRVTLPALPAVASASGLFEPFVSGIPFHLPGIPAADAPRPQFAPLLSAWIAQLYAVGGDALLYRFNLLTTLACGGLVYALVRRVVRYPFALVALAVFAFNPATTWMARINLAEPLGAAFALAGLLVLLQTIRAPSPARTVAAVLLLALAAFVRIDLIVIAPLLTAAALALAVSRPDQAWSRTLLRASVWVLVGQVAAIALVMAWSPPYVDDHLRFLMLAPAASAAGIGIYGVLRRVPVAPLRGAGAVAVSAALVVAFVYAWLVRPYVEPFALIPERGSALAGTRDWREESLSSLAAYVTWPCLLLALGGALVVIRRAGRGRGGASALVLGVLAVGAGFVYLGAPQVSPDHPWAVRRMFPLVIPFVVLIGAYGLQAVAQRALGWGHAQAAHVVTLAGIAWLLVHQRTSLIYTENAGVTALLRAIDARLPPGPLVLRGFEGLATTFALGFGRDVLPLRDEAVAVDAASRAFWQACDVRPCTLLHGSYEGLGGLTLAAQGTGELTREFIEPTVHPLARTRKRETLRWLVSRVSGIATAPPPSNAGAARDWRLADRGLYRDELAPGIVARWTNGDADVAIAPAKADRLEVRLASALPGAQPVRIDLDGKTLFEGTIEPGEARWQFALEVGNEGSHRMMVRSASFVPAQQGNGGDRRTLGVSVRAVRALVGTPPLLTAASSAQDFRSNLAVRPTWPSLHDETRTVHTFRADVDNLGTASWPARAEDSPGGAVVALGIYATRAGDARRLLEQRIALPYALAPGEHWATALAVDVDAAPWRGLPPGDYLMHVGLVLEGVAWFADRGDRNATIPLTIAAR